MQQNGIAMSHNRSKRKRETHWTEEEEYKDDRKVTRHCAYGRGCMGCDECLEESEFDKFYTETVGI